MGWTIGIPSLKLNKTGMKSKHCGDFRSVAEEALMERKGHDPDINPELAAQNIYQGFRTAADLLDYSDAHCSMLRDASGRELRKDAVRMCATIFKPPAAMMAEMSQEDQMRFLGDGVAKIREIVGEENVKSVAWHFDEQGGHVHVFWEPMTEDGRLCAKELHGLKFFNRLNREMPAHLRECGWDIDDCNAYDAAKEELMTEKEKAERRQKNGRSSAVYKAAAQRELNEINRTIDQTLDTVDVNIQSLVQESVEAAASADANVYENVLFLMAECDDARFEELDREGRELKKKWLKESVEESQVPRSVHQMIEEARSGRTKSLSWKERQELWDAYRVLSDDFWRVRAELNEDYQKSISDAYRHKRDAHRSYYDAMYLLHHSRSLVTTLIAVVWALIAMNRESRYNEELQVLRKERDKLVRNTASFKKYSNAYREDLKAGRPPFDGYLTSMAKLVYAMDREEQLDRKRAPAHRQELDQR